MGRAESVIEEIKSIIVEILCWFDEWRERRAAEKADREAGE